MTETPAQAGPPGGGRHPGASLGKVGFIGLGVMGRPMARNLLAAGAALIVHNRSRAAQDALAAAGATGAESPAAVAAAAGIIITMLADDQAVRSVVGGELIPAARPGTLLIDMSTVSPALSRELAAGAAARGVRMLDAPVSGGDAGAGQVVKACNQVLVAITIAGVSEALVLGGRLGVGREVILDVLSRGLAANRVMELRRENFLNRSYPPGFRVDLHHKDLGIALDSAGQASVPLPLTAGTQQLLRQLRAAGRGGEDHTAILAAVEALAAPGPARPEEETG